MSDEDRFLSRWSRRKQSAAHPAEAAEAVAPTEPDLAAAPGDAAQDTSDTRTDEQILAELGLPDPATLKPGDDIKGFMRAAVPDRLRRLALRQLWRSNPVLANLDELLEYGEDYTDAAMVVENLQTAYKVGRGFWTEEDERLAAEAERRAESEAEGRAAIGKAEAEAGTDPDDAGPGQSDPESVDAGSADVPAPDTQQAAATPESAPDSAPDGPEHAATARRMTFQFET